MRCFMYVLIHDKCFFISQHYLYCINVSLSLQINFSDFISSIFKAILLLCVLVAQSCLTLCNPTDCILTDSSVHGTLQARILEWIAIPFSGDLSNPGIKPRSPTLQAEYFLSEPSGKPYCFFKHFYYLYLFLF